MDVSGDESSQIRKEGHEWTWEDAEQFSSLMLVVCQLRKPNIWTIDGEQMSVTKTEEVEGTGGFMAQKAALNIATKRMFEDRGAVSNEVGNAVREYKGHA